MSYSFTGGVTLPSNREKSMHKPLLDLSDVEVVRIPLGGSGIDYAPAVEAGQSVEMGQIIGTSTNLSDFYLRASVSGVVREIADGVLPDGRVCAHVVIENDGRGGFSPLPLSMDWQMMEPEAISEQIRAAGIVDRTGFPVFASLGRLLGKADTLIVNGIDGEVWVSSIYRTLCDEADDVVEGIHVLMRLFGRLRCIVAMPEEKGEAADAMRAAAGTDNRIRFMPLRDKYPQADEHLLVRTITGREGKDLAEMRCVVLGAPETAAVGRALRDGMPDLARIVTVSGDAAANPRNVRARAGTSWADMVRALNGYLETPRRLLLGDVMRAMATFTDTVSFMPGIPGFTALLDDGAEAAPRACIRCGRCAMVCPYGLIPAFVHALSAAGRTDKLNYPALASCTLCGACAYICPSHIRLAHDMRKVLEERQDQEDGR